MKVVIALGSNLGDRKKNLKLGIKALEFLGVVEYSSLWLDTPDESDVGPSFLNTVSVLYTSIEDPMILLESLLRIELILGRDRDTGLNAPRIIDLDLICIRGISGFWSWSTPFDLRILGYNLTLELPHPRAYRRSFVFEPMIAMDLCIS